MNSPARSVGCRLDALSNTACVPRRPSRKARSSAHLATSSSRSRSRRRGLCLRRPTTAGTPGLGVPTRCGGSPGSGGWAGRDSPARGPDLPCFVSAPTGIRARSVPPACDPPSGGLPSAGSRGRVQLAALRRSDVASPERVARRASRGGLFQHRCRTGTKLFRTGLGQPRGPSFRCGITSYRSGGAVSPPRTQEEKWTTRGTGRAAEQSPARSVFTGESETRHVSPRMGSMTQQPRTCCTSLRQGFETSALSHPAFCRASARIGILCLPTK